MTCGPHTDRWARRAEVERIKQQQRAMWTAALTGAVSGAVNGARGGGPQVRVGDVERESAIAALGEHYVAGRLTKEELDERADAAWSARTSGDLAPLFRDLPALPPPAPVRRPRREAQRRSWRMGMRLTWVFVLLMVLAVTSHVPWFALLVFVGLWWSGVFSGLHRWTHSRR
jgi:hypothetical protein